MKIRVVLVSFFVPIFSISTQTLHADTVNGDSPYLTKGKFALPLDTEAVEQEWSARGYYGCEVSRVEKGWALIEHRHDKFILFGGKTGQIQFTIEGERYVLEPGDEFYYPKGVIHATKNLHDGDSEWLVCWKWL